MKGNCGECERRWMCDIDPDKCDEWPDPLPMTNAQKIRAMTDEELAKNNVHQTYEYTVDYDYDDNPVGEYAPCWKTSDGTIFWDEEAAIEWEMKWLKLPCGGADHE